MYNVLTIGDAVMDTHLLIDDATLNCDQLDHGCKICFDYGAKIPITDSFQSLGGNAANVAVGLAILGFNTGIITAIGADNNGKTIKSELKKQRVDTRLVNVDPKSKTRFSTILNFKGERTVLSYHRRRRYHWPPILPPADWIYYTSLSEGFENFQNKLIKFLKTHSAVKLAVNPGSFQLKKSLNKILEIIQHTDILFVNVQEAELLAKTTLTEVKSIAALIHQLIGLGAKEVVITDGNSGAWAGNDADVYYHGTYPVTVVAKTGAGDAFSSGYLAARLDGHGPAEGLRFGTANASGVVSHFGSQKGMLNKNGLKKMITKFPAILPKEVLLK